MTDDPHTPETILVAVAWPYASGSRHLGHLAGAYLPADVFARHQRRVGNEVVMVSGSDVHGTPITVRADAEGGAAAVEGRPCRRARRRHRRKRLAGRARQEAAQIVGVVHAAVVVEAVVERLGPVHTAGGA